MRQERSKGMLALASLILSASFLLFACSYHFRQQASVLETAEATAFNIHRSENSSSSGLRSSLFVKHEPERGEGEAHEASRLSWLAGAQIPLQAVDFKTPEGVDYHVDVEVFFETQDPASKIFTEWVLVQVVGAPGLLDILRLRIVPWGRASLIDTGKGLSKYTVDGKGNATNVTLDPGGPAPSFLCEHGPSECEGNVWMSCIQALYPDVLKWFRVTTCIQVRACAAGQAPTADSIAHTGSMARRLCEGTPGEVAPKCVKEFGTDMSLPKIKECINSRMGSELLLASFEETKALDPPLQMLPWVVVEGEVLNLPNQTNLFLLGKTICDAYVRKLQPYVNGTVPRPLGCYYFPSVPPYLPRIPVANYWGIDLLWAIGGVSFLTGVMILLCWKYHTTIASKEDDDARDAEQWSRQQSGSMGHGGV